MRWWVFVGALAGILSAAPGTHGACVYEGSLHANQSSWRPESCRECTCHGDVPLCSPVRCPNLQCDFQRGENLRLPPNQCCPECTSSSPDSCQYEGVTYGHDSQWSPSPCSRCVCSRGRVSCAAHPCPQLTCSPGQSLLVPPGKCCPRCGGNGASCSWQGGIYRDGEEWKPTICSRCSCSNGKVQCWVVECPQVACRAHENLVIQPGRCCPRCVSTPCLSAGHQQQHGELWKKNTCTTCVCDKGQSKCHTHTCRPVTCDEGLTKVRRPGQCCDECAPARGSCLYQDVVRYHGDMWNGTGCEFCSCNRGQVLCRRAECGRVECLQGSELVHLPGKCCPECSPVKPSCLLEGKSYQNLARWAVGRCRECECHDAQVTCYLGSCPTCPLGTLAVIKEGHCCPDCLHVQCHTDCLSCLGTPDHCESCRNPKALLHLGRCLSVCPPGFYSEGQGCTACPSSCATCSSRWVCQSCSPQRPVLSPERDQCLVACPPGSYQQDHTRCVRCHESCSECRGPSQQNCSSCSEPAALLQDGVCVSDCGPGFYSQDGVCYACDWSCASCFPDNPKCMSCPVGAALHHGKCITQCPPQHYLDGHSRCRACHSSCASCWGPSVSQCSSCPGGLLLHQGQCVESCGEGLYAQDSSCHNCHPSCRSCVGPLASDCLRCLKPEDVLLPQSALLQHGVCTAGCAARSFLDHALMCRECDPSCQLCTGPSAENCTSCSPPSSLHEGQCVPTCPQGFFTHNHQCQVCHPTCQTCSGSSEADCTSCPPRASLQNGYCRTSCQEGHYLSAIPGECLRCSSDCQRCTADLQTGIGSVCLRCKAPRTWLLGDHCVSQCPSGRYSWHGACIKCHPSCESCRGAGPLSCTSCPTNNFLLDSGLCSPKCPIGYFDNGLRSCQACDSQCLTCHAAAVCTTCRDPARVLLFGECQYDSCAHQYYLNTTTRTCRECDWSCNACKGPQRTDCLQCMEGYLLQDGVCTQRCSPGSYQDGDRCISCDDHCLTCQGPGRCLECRPPYATLRGQCVLQCGRSYFLDVSSNDCKSCSSDCVLCDEVGRCKACRNPTYLMEGYCTPDCGRGFYSDRRTRTCLVNTHAPVLHIHGSLLVPLGGSAPLQPPLLQVRDPDGASERLVFQLVHVPNNGRLFLLTPDAGDGEGWQELGSGDSFTWAELKLSRVHFTHLNDKSRAGEFSLRVADPQLFSQPAKVPVQAVSMQPPRVVTLAPLTLDSPRLLATITKSVLHIDDLDNPADVFIMVLEPPRHGRLTRLHGDRGLSRFKLEELSQEQIQYVHDVSEGTEDSLVLQVNDGHSYQNVLLQIHITHKAQDSPHLVTLPMTWVREGGMVRLDKKYLQTDYKGVGADDVIYTILTSDGKPKYGEVVLISMPADGPPEGWSSSLPEDGVFTSTTSFTQQDVYDGTVWYRHFGVGSDGDSFLFQVSSDVSPVLQSDAQMFTIGVLPQIPGFPQLAPDCDLQIAALEDRVTEITPSALSFVDSETPSEKLSYNITKPLLPGQGAIEHRDKPYTAVKIFTQADVDTGKIIYRPPAAPSHLQELYQYSFIGLPESLSVYFTVSDGEHTTPELDFAILLLSNHQQPPVFQVLDPLLEVRVGGQAAIGGQQLAVTDADTAPDELEFELVDAPVHGQLIKTDDGTRMDSGHVFTFSDVTRKVLLYQHAGLSTQDDAMSFSVSDGISMATTVVQVVLLVEGGDGPQRDPAALLSLEVGEKSSTIIRRSHVAYTDKTSPDDEIHIQLVSVPMYGNLTRTESQQEPQQLKEYSSFTMEDINTQKIRYVTSLETGGQPVTDSFHFVVHDGDDNRLDNQMCTVTITSMPRQPLVATVRSGIKVQEGGRVLLSTNHIAVLDDDSSRTDLLVWIVAPPKYGFIENINRGGSVGGSHLVTTDVPFSVEDLKSGHIFYVQDSRRKPESSQDAFSFYISDGHSQTEAFSVEIDIQRTEEVRKPTVSVSSIHVEENSGVIITNSSLSVHDEDTPESEILFTIVRIPTYGKLRRRQFYSQPLGNGRVLTQGSTFTYQDVLDRLLVYVPETVNGGVDEMGFTLTDGVHTHTGRLEFTMDVRRTEGPRMTINRGLQLPAGSSSKITEQNLKGSDIDSDSLKLRYVLTKDPPVGRLLLSRTGHPEKVSVKGPVQSFTQDDVNKGLLQYRHEKGQKGGSLSLKFNLVDPEGNKLIDQSFFISVLEDHLPPSVEVNKGLVLDENSMKKLTTLQLSASDQDSEPGELVYRITKEPSLGHLEHTASPGARIPSFTQADLVSRSIQYVHTSTEEKHADQFSFSLSDGTNEVAQTFYITIKPVDDSLPLLQIPGMRVQEGVRKTITEFELKATDADTEAESVTFTVVQPPRHGAIERTSNGQHYRHTSTFTMDDIYQNRISYNHDGSNSLKDRFTFSVADGTNLFFMVEEDGKEIVTAAPQKFKIEILPVDDGTPRIVTNLGLQWLEYMDNKAVNLITKKELLTVDPDTDDTQLVYEVTAQPKHGVLENKVKPRSSVTSFTQADINLGLIRYVLHQENVLETMDNFQFLVKDSKPNVVSGNVFHIQWSLISFQHKSHNVSEKAATVAITVKRTGNLNQYAIVLCRTEQGSAKSTGSHPGQHDYVEFAGQVQFDEREDTKVCTIVINDDKVFEGIESFHVELSMPVYALLGPNTRTIVYINDTEDEPTLQFDKKTYHVNESSGLFHAAVERRGDASSTVSALCYTVAKSARGSSLHGVESGSDYKSRGMSSDNRVIFGPGVSMSTCDVKLIDDSEYELSEDFELVLSDASENARTGDLTVAKIIIDGPNDASVVTLRNATFTFSEDAGTIEIPVLRRGSDLSSVTSVWCATRLSDPPSASPGVDYIPSSKKVEFKPGKTEETCSLTIMDDVQNPAIEGPESFVVFLSSPQGAVLQEPYEANVIITDTFQDIPTMQFEKSSYTIKEKETVLHIPVIRTGDLFFKSSVRCFTRTMSAMVMDDFEERKNTDESRITFLKGEKVRNCSVHINDDSVFEPEEEFEVHLGTPLGDHWSGAMVGPRDVVTITITNDEDAPTVEFEQASYQVREPSIPDGVEEINIKVIRRGDLDRTSKIRCSTRDGSAQSGVDYNPKSRVLKFPPGVDHILFKVEILSNEDREWHESFSLVLGPDDPVEAVLGKVTMATVTILDQEAAGSLILPAPPIVVSLADYDQVQEVTKEGSGRSPSPGYPLVCVTPCDPHYPKFSVMKEHCQEAGINQTQVHFSWEVAAPTDSSGARSPFETVTDTTPFTGVNHMVLDSIYFSRRFHVRCKAQARDKAGHLGTPLRSNIVIVGTEGSICHTPITTGNARGFQAQSFIATLKYLDVKHKEHPNRIHISVQIPHQDGMLPLLSTMPLHNLHFLLSESIYRQQHICSNLVTIRELQGLSDSGFLEDVSYDSISLGPGYDRPYQFNPNVREAKSIQLYKHLNLKSCIWTFDAYYDMTELIDICGGSVTADFQVRDSAQSFLTVQVPLYVSYIYVTAPRGWASLEHHTEMEFSFFYDTVLWRTGIQTDSVLSARLQIIRIFIREDGRLVIEFKTHAKFRGQFVLEHHTLPGHASRLTAPDHLGGMEFDLQLLWSAQTFDSPYQLWRATSSYSRKDYSGGYTVFLIPCTVQPTQPWVDPGDKPLSCTAHAPEKFLVPIAFQQTNRPVPVVYSLNTEFQLCNNEKVFLLDPATTDVSMAEMDYKGAFSMGQTLYGRVLWNPEQNLNAAYKLQLEKVYLCTGRDGYVPFFDPTGTLYNEGPQYGCIQPNKHLKHRFLLLDRSQPDVCDLFFHDVPFEADFASDVAELQSMASMPGVDGFTMKVDALYKVEAGHQWYLQVIYVISPESHSSTRIQRSVTYQLSRSKRDLVDRGGRLMLDDSLIYDNEGDQVKNGTNMKSLHLELSPSPTFNAHVGGSVGGGVAALTLMILVLLASCFLFRRCRRAAKKKSEAAPKGYEEYPLNTKVEVCMDKCVEKNFSSKHCTVRNVNINRNQEASGKVKQVNLEVKVLNNLSDGTEV
ncbi:extracellular matrix organizing protein FRAS1 isoform X2 [Nothobranchius furzeri]|uniref:Fraser extracellular matrix complex subunit 1 n=2 Tax=Nothobranchius furzeri TaxID=105023 RepID=A0A9D3BEH6_NOTFU|nr:extracellular matrix protein FRAS1 isoform X1 [Nothobranchius furzeri]KAF7205299.1 Fraser extracellular matrix complex subunit 1 [Nothobranchius furzeri]